MTAPLTKSCFVPLNLNKPIRQDLTFSEVFDEVKKERRESLFVHMDTGERVTNLSVLDKGEKYARGLLTLGLEPGVDNIAVVGCATLQALSLFVAAAELGYGFAPLFCHPPRETRMITELTAIAPKVIITGEGIGGLNFNSLVGLFDEGEGKPSSKMLPFVERLFYDSSYKDRSPSHKFLQTLDDLIKLGENVSDEQFLRAKHQVKPEFAVSHYFTSGSSGTPKCVSYSQKGFAYAASRLSFSKEPALQLNIGVDTCIGYMFALDCLAGHNKKGVMIPESFEDNISVNMGQVLTQAIIDESLGQLQLTLGTLRVIIDYVKVNKIVLPRPLTVFYGGQIISPRLLAENEKLLPGLHYTAYGMTEAGYVAGNISRGGDCFTQERRLYPLPEMELKLVNENDLVVDIGVPGEVLLKSPTMFKEYRNDKALTKETFTPEGFFKTGDRAVMHEDGSFEILGRISYSERFNVFCETEYATPIEFILNEHPDITQAHVVSGKLNDWFGDELTYCIRMSSPEATIPEQDLLDFCEKKGMNVRQRPARVLYFEKFPMTDNGRKMSKPKLTTQVKAMVAEDDGVGKCKWFAEMEKKGKC